jgi:CheY-like chemotaxis protein
MYQADGQKAEDQKDLGQAEEGHSLPFEGRMRFLCIDDNDNDRFLVGNLVKRTKHWEFFEADSISAGLLSCQEESPQVILIDLKFAGRPIAETYQAIYTMSQLPDACVIVVSGDDSQDAVNKSRDAGATAFFNKKALLDPKAFHDAVLIAVSKNIGRGIGKSAADTLLLRIADDIYHGNGKPGVLARLEGVDVKIDNLKDAHSEMQISQDKEFAEIRNRAARIEDKLFGDNMMAWARWVLQMVAILLWGFLTYEKVKSHEEALNVVPPGFGEPAEK